MNVYNFLILIEGHLSSICSGPFPDDASAIAFLSNFQIGLYKIEKCTQVDTDTITKTIILDQTE